MTTSALIAEARRVGLSLRLESDNKLKWTSSSPPPPELLARLRDHKADLIAALGNIEHRGHRGHRVDEADHWLTFYEERAAIREYDCGLPRPEAEAGALQEAIAHWLVRNPLTPGVPEDGCMHCAGRVAGRLPCRGPGRGWLHQTCMQEMNEARLCPCGERSARASGVQVSSGHMPFADRSAQVCRSPQPAVLETEQFAHLLRFLARKPWVPLHRLRNRIEWSVLVPLWQHWLAAGQGRRVAPQPVQAAAHNLAG